MHRGHRHRVCRRLRQTGISSRRELASSMGKLSPAAQTLASQRPHSLHWEPGCLILNTSLYQTMALPSGYDTLHTWPWMDARVSGQDMGGPLPESQLDSRERTLGVPGERLSLKGWKLLGG